MLHKQVSFIVDSKGVKQAAVVPIDIYNELMTLQKALSDNKPGERELYHFNGKGQRPMVIRWASGRTPVSWSRRAPPPTARMRPPCARR
jgi:hypothetical protein